MLKQGLSLLLFGIVMMQSPPSWGDDWPQWMGPERNDVWEESGIVEQLPKDGPKVLWRQEVAKGYSGPAVYGDYVVVTDYVITSGEAKNDPGGRPQLKGRERVQCLEESTGKILWTYEYDCEYQISYPSGPRCTPTIDTQPGADKVYTLGAEGNLTCLQLSTGKLVWAKDLKQAYHTTAPVWGFAGHPLIFNDQLICLVGGEGSVAVSFNKNDGTENWKALSASEPGYAPPTLIEAGGTKQLLIWDADKLNSLNPTNGHVYWSYPLKPSYGMAIMGPQKSGNQLFASAYENTGAMFKLDPNEPAVTLDWMADRKSAFFAVNTTPLFYDDVLYGMDSSRGSLIALDPKDGSRLWESFQPAAGERRMKNATAFITRNHDQFFLMNDQGELIIAKLTRKGYTEISRAPILKPTGENGGRSVVWSHPAYAHKKLFARNDQEIVCIDLAR
jgi:outer membrane protein assembly factor BamB